jgi:protein-L-isoaspartate(D-aspartate) O-methyltransferase
VHSVEIFPDLAATARASLLRTGAHNVTVELADAFALADTLRHDVVVLTGSLPVYDARFERWLAPGGRLFAVVGQGPVMEAVRVTCTGPGEWLRESLFETAMDPLIHAAEPPRFVF